MPRIALYISIALMFVACEPLSTQSESGHVTIAELRSRARYETRSIESDIYVEGYVVANDKFNELECAIVIDDGTAGVELAIDSRTVNRCVPLFSFVRLRCSGLSICREGERVLLGAHPTGEYVVDRVAEDCLFNYINVVDAEGGAPVPRSMTIAQLSGLDVLSYVTIYGLSVVDEDCGKHWCDVSEDDATQYVTTLRHFTDGRDTISILTSGFCDYASESIPSGRFSATGIVDWRDHDIALRLTSCQIIYEE